MISDTSYVMWATPHAFKGYDSTGALPSDSSKINVSPLTEAHADTADGLWSSLCANPQTTQVTALISYSLKCERKQLMFCSYGVVFFIQTYQPNVVTVT